jgi:hypothetical protein
VSIIRDTVDGKASLRFYTGELLVDDAVIAAGHTPNGYFWEGVVAFLDPTLADAIELDSEAGMFAAYAEPDQLQRLRNLIGPLLTDSAAITTVIEDANEAGFEFDD